MRQRPPTACRHTVSGTISLPSQGFFSPFPHGTGSLSVTSEYLALGDGPPGFTQGFSCPALLRIPLRLRSVFVYGALTLSGRLFQTVPLTAPSPTGAVLQPRRRFPFTGLGSSAFARRYWRNHSCFLLLQVLRWFTSLGSLCLPYGFRKESSDFFGWGFPIQKSPDRCLLAAPRSFSQLATSFIACLCQGIHCMPLVA